MTASAVIVVDMEQLSALDAGFLEAEDADPHISLAIGGIAILDGPVEPQDVLVASLTDRLAAIPRFTQVLRVHTLKYKAPQWETDPNFDILRHVRRVAVPAPGDDGALFDLAADIMAHRLDREHPLWEC
jgi:diacylglycerol O-acyltransferase / wax synthase